MSYLFFSFVFFVLQRAFFYFLCTVSGCDGGNRTLNIAVYTWRFSPLSYGRDSKLWLSPMSYGRHPRATAVMWELRPSPWATAVTLSYGRHPELRPSPWATAVTQSYGRVIYIVLCASYLFVFVRYLFIVIHYLFICACYSSLLFIYFVHCSTLFFVFFVHCSKEKSFDSILILDCVPGILIPFK
jgi:hypothetical protein